MENRDGIVTERVSRKLTIATPSAELVDAYLTEIAKAYGVKWSPVPTSTVDNHDGPDGETKESAEEKVNSPESFPKANTSDTAGPSTGAPKLPDIPPTEDAEAKGKPAATTKSSTPPPVYNKAPPEDDFEALTRRFEALKKRF